MKNKLLQTEVPIYTVDAFTDVPFSGNPAAVCVLSDPIEEELMLKIAAEMNLSETAFVFPVKDGELSNGNSFRLRWFTPKVEVPICGHGTLATSKVLFEEYGLNFDKISYITKSGTLTAVKYENKIALDFPLDKPKSFNASSELLSALGISSYKNAIIGEDTRKLVIEIESPEIVKKLKPNFMKLEKVEFEEVVKGVAVTAASTGKYDFISRYFNPWAGVNEDPVTGSVHTLLTTYWSKLLHKKELLAYQASPRGGEIQLRVGDAGRVDLIGDAVIISKGKILLG
jgi:PhzF family phenazine biosynthesis protein